jgi:hypothetical protein
MSFRVCIFNTLILFSIFFVSACKKKCTSTTTNHSRSQILIDQSNPGNPHWDQAIANFNFSQSTIQHSGDECDADECSTSLTIENTTDSAFVVAFTLSYSYGTAFWNYNGSVEVDSGSTKSAGEISKSCSDVSLGSLQMIVASISYQ